MPVRTNVRAGLHGIEKPLYRVFELRVQVQVGPPPRRIRSAPVAKPEKPAVPAKPAEEKAEDELEEMAEKTEDLEEDDALIVDADELGDDDDLGDVVVEKDEEQT